jgi:hypothetical protein
LSQAAERYPNAGHGWTYFCSDVRGNQWPEQRRKGLSWYSMSVAIVILMHALAMDTHTVAANFPADLYGPVDTRMSGQTCAGGPCIWGHADSALLPVVFHPPAGYRVRILALRGDLVGWIKTLPGDPATPLESAVGILGGFQTSSSLTAGYSPLCAYCVEGCPLYIQDALTEKQPKTRAPFDYNNLNLLLDSDNTLHVKIAAYLNTTGKPAHLEITYTIQFRYEIPGAGMR